MKNNIVAYNDPFELIDPFFDDFFKGERNSYFSQLMKTDIKDFGDHYEFKVELPEVKKEDIHLSLKNGYLTIQAKHVYENEESSKGTYVKKERHIGSYKRSYYVGENVVEEDIKAKLSDGVLTLNINKKDKQESTPKFIPIE